MAHCHFIQGITVFYCFTYRADSLQIFEKDGGYCG